MAFFAIQTASSFYGETISSLSQLLLNLTYSFAICWVFRLLGYIAGIECLEVLAQVSKQHSHLIILASNPSPPRNTRSLQRRQCLHTPKKGGCRVPLGVQRSKES